MTGYSFARHFLVLSLFLSFLSSSFVFASPHSAEIKAQQKTDLNVVLRELEVQYGMERYKAEVLGVTLAGLKKKYEALIDAPEHHLAKEEFEQLLVALAAELQDGHTNIFRTTRNVWSVGIYTASIQGKLYVVGFNKEFFVKENSERQVEVGDEITHINGVDVKTLAFQRLPYIQRATFESRLQGAMESLLTHTHRNLPALKNNGTVDVTFKKPNASAAKPADGVTYKGYYHWINHKDYSDFNTLKRYLRPKEHESAPNDKFIFGFDSVDSPFSVGLERALKGSPGSIINIGELLNIEIEAAHKKKEIAAAQEKLGILKANSTSTQSLELSTEEQALAELRAITRLKVYLVQTKNKSIGVVRIPDYSPDTFQDVKHEIRWLAALIEQMNSSTDGLIIDQLNNGGGYVYYGTHFAKLFAKDGKLDSGTIEFKLNQTIINYLNHIVPIDDANVPGQAHNYGRIYFNLKTVEELNERYKQGDKWSGKVASGFSTSNEKGFFEEGKILAHSVKTYQKPIVFLNDSRSGSCGDFVPAVLQSNNRILLVGETSMGLGGPVYREQATLPGSEMWMRSTYGYNERPRGLPIENLGVIPDVSREFTNGDLKDGFASYANEILAASEIWIAKGASKEKVRSYFEKNEISKMPPLVAKLQKEVSLFKDIIVHVNDPELRFQLFQDFVSELDSFFNKSAKLVANEFTLTIPMPLDIAKADLLLSGLSKPDEIRERLNQMNAVASGKHAKWFTMLNDILAKSWASKIKFYLPLQTCEAQLLP